MCYHVRLTVENDSITEVSDNLARVENRCRVGRRLVRPDLNVDGLRRHG
jgi:hypothetical protein